MRISVRVKPGSRIAAVEKEPDGIYTCRVREPAKEGRANDAVVRALAEHFGVAKSRVAIVKGSGSKHKIVDIS